ncbi:GNAT family N-acetyltransferase [Stigmatella sp. ncwal1]|uniref:GNAT family N-acetyltransferase n=1 Tax=Stigmatella ashevillensis TaxID=2995309 RepID=A0ABT5DD12_9BACT|nr:GNAT family N-acetyltransferase [Stigmatella ashevillena]MDC0711570.1 GNAT family N-acetyltransferase [Stigmatella ashevillena]
MGDSAEDFEIVPATRPWQVQQTRTLILEYAAALGMRLDFQDFTREMDAFPADYAPPGGCLFLATGDHGPGGCAGLRPLTPGICEMKRLYVRVRHRSHGLGQRLALAAIAEARALRYTCMRLDTLPTMHIAIGLYQHLGFQPTAPSGASASSGALCFELKL